MFPAFYRPWAVFRVHLHWESGNPHLSARHFSVPLTRHLPTATSYSQVILILVANLNMADAFVEDSFTSGKPVEPSLQHFVNIQATSTPPVRPKAGLLYLYEWSDRKKKSKFLHSLFYSKCFLEHWGELVHSKTAEMFISKMRDSET